MNVLEKLRDGELLNKLGRRLQSLKLPRPLTFMEVCGTHTMAVHRSGLPALLPEGMRLLSGPGCPVCVTSGAYLDTALAMAREHGVTLATFGDMVRVPGSAGSLASLRAEGGDIEVVYSPLGALELARQNPGREVVFLAVGFETTSPAVAATVKSAAEEGVKNFHVLCAHKLIPPALLALLQDPDIGVDGFMLPGHVSVILGARPYRFAAEEYGCACVIAGFDPADILQALLMLAAQLDGREPSVEIQYRRGVKPEGNEQARAIQDEVFAPADASWRGFGLIPESGLELREAFAELDAIARFPVEVEPAPEPEGCLCGEVVRGKIEPADCPLFGRSCMPETPVGPCMVSSEGTCAAFYKYSYKSSEVAEGTPGDG